MFTIFWYKAIYRISSIRRLGVNQQIVFRAHRQKEQRRQFQRWIM